MGFGPSNDNNNNSLGESLEKNNSQQQQQRQPSPMFLSGGGGGGGTLPDLNHDAAIMSSSAAAASSYQPAPPSARQQFTRSHPIAIKRNNTNAYPNAAARGGNGTETSDEEEDEDDSFLGAPNNNEVERDAVRLGLVSDRLTSHSLPSRLLRAPLLGSVPTNEDYLLYRDIPTATLPPPMALNDQPPSLSGVVMAEQTKISYGSLRESNQKGRFLDGPSSYRDSRTGDIRRMQQRVRFDEQQQRQQQTSSSSDANNNEATTTTTEAAHLSIRDRMKQARERNHKNAAANKDKKPTSSLAAMFDDANNNSNNNQADASSSAGATPATFDDFSSPFYENPIRALPQGALSTSLTGLEMLQRGLRLATITDHDSHQSDDQLPRDANGHNSLLSRSLSDPRGTGRRLAETQQRSPVLPSYPQAPNQFLPPLALGGTFLAPGGSGVVVSHLSAALQQQQPVSSQAQAQFDVALENRAANPDLEGAFEMDLE